MLTTKKSSNKIEQLLKKLASQILADLGKNNSDIALIGIHRRGVPLAQRLRKILGKNSNNIPMGTLDITLYRDDLNTVGPAPIIKGTDIKFDITGKHVILVDDVLFTGRTIRAALDEIMDFGRPKSIKLGVMVDRGHRELPIQADYVGQVIKTTLSDIIKVKVAELDGKDDIVYERKK
ncbi:MAG: bifunctional pyr operon transcriptional regulator/uracil phosphoribosyltransferase PyrR [Candidatus Brocadiia bacterium]